MVLGLLFVASYPGSPPLAHAFVLSKAYACARGNMLFACMYQLAKLINAWTRHLI